VAVAVERGAITSSDIALEQKKASKARTQGREGEGRRRSRAKATKKARGRQNNRQEGSEEGTMIREK
jgi:hypothetical protein